MHNIESLAIYDAVEEEVQRTTYPPSFPPLPAVPTGRYIDPQFFDLEMQHVWHKTWLTAGHISELPKPGSYKLFRSEEHTSELQSLMRISYAVFCLKKKTTNTA